MKQTTSDWFSTLTQQARKYLVCLLFDLDSKARSHQHYGLFKELRLRLDDEYHGLK